MPFHGSVLHDLLWCGGPLSGFHCLKCNKKAMHCEIIRFFLNAPFSCCSFATLQSLRSHSENWHLQLSLHHRLILTHASSMKYTNDLHQQLALVKKTRRHVFRWHSSVSIQYPKPNRGPSGMAFLCL